MAKKSVIAAFTVDTQDHGKAWHKSDVALALDIKFSPNSDTQNATVWDSFADFMADVKDGHFPVKDES